VIGLVGERDLVEALGVVGHAAEDQGLVLARTADAVSHDVPQWR
jgi:hypothetical protein